MKSLCVKPQVSWIPNPNSIPVDLFKLQRKVIVLIQLRHSMMEDSCGPRKRKRASVDADIKLPIPTSSEASAGNDQPVPLPHLVVGKILEYLDFKDVLRCSSINKVWNYEARRLLREKHQCALTVDLDKKSAKDITNFKSILTTSELPLPCGSLSIKSKKYPMPLPMWSKEVERAQMAIKEIILRAGPFDVIQLDIKWDLGTSFGACIIWSVLAAMQKTVKVLKIKDLNGSDLFGNVEGLPELTKLEVDTEAKIGKPDVLRIQNFVNHSLKLETVGCLSAKWLPLLDKLPPSRKLVLVKEFTCADISEYPEEAEKLAALEPKLEKLFVPRIQYCFCYHCRPTSRISMSLLLLSQASLIELQATYEMLQDVRREKPMASFVNLRYLTLDIPSGMEREGLDRNATIIALCPKLEKLEIVTAPMDNNLNPNPNRNLRSRKVRQPLI